MSPSASAPRRDSGGSRDGHALAVAQADALGAAILTADPAVAQYPAETLLAR